MKIRYKNFRSGAQKRVQPKKRRGRPMDVTPVPMTTATGTAQHWTARLRLGVAAPLACPFENCES
eukprot:7238558-Pyramimonas_sp.AAC.1